jgi:hypothetical protein
MRRHQYFLGIDGTLYRRRQSRVEVFSAFSVGDWCSVRVPVRYPMRPIAWPVAMARLWRQKRSYRRFVRAVGA